KAQKSTKTRKKLMAMTYHHPTPSVIAALRTPVRSSACLRKTRTRPMRPTITAAAGMNTGLRITDPEDGSPEAVTAGGSGFCASTDISLCFRLEGLDRVHTVELRSSSPRGGPLTVFHITRLSAGATCAFLSSRLSPGPLFTTVGTITCTTLHHRKRDGHERQGIRRT